MDVRVDDGARDAVGRTKGIPFVVLDRPNPIGGEIVEGALLDPAFKSFVGMYPIPARHGMTVGELHPLQQGITSGGAHHRANGELAPFSMARQHRSPVGNPSPNLRSPARLKNYPGTVYSRARTSPKGGTDRPFEQVGAPWLDAPRSRKHDEWKPPARRPLRGDHDAGRNAPRKSFRADHSRHPVGRHRSRSLPTREDVAAADRRNQAAASGGVRVGRRSTATGSDKVSSLSTAERFRRSRAMGLEAASFRETTAAILLYDDVCIRDDRDGFSTDWVNI